MIPFNKSSITKLEEEYTIKALSGKICGDGSFTKTATKLLGEILGTKNLLLTTSCTHSLELSALLTDIKAGDEVILPSYTFVSTVNAFLLRGAHPVFCDIDPSTMNMDSKIINSLINSRTRAIVPVHYAGVCCDMDAINNIAKNNNLIVIEDAAQAIGSTYKGAFAGTLSDYGCYSFHETKNYTMGEGGAIFVKDSTKFKEAEIIREKGTDRSRFLRGEVDKYSWKSIGSSYLPSDILSAILLAQLERFNEIMNKRLTIWNMYNSGFESLEKQGKIKRPHIPEHMKHNAHMYYLITNSEKERNNLISEMAKKEVQTIFHYIPLHSSDMGFKLNYKAEDLPLTEEYSKRLIRLPLWTDMNLNDVEYIIESLNKCL